MCCHVANQNKHPGSLRGHGICHNNSVISSKLRWFPRIPDLQTTWNRTCRQFSVYILICIALLCGFADTAIPQRFTEQREHRWKSRLLPVLIYWLLKWAVEGSWHRFPASRFLRDFWVLLTPGKSPSHDSWAASLPVSGVHRPRKGHIIVPCSSPTTSALPSPYATTFPKPAPSGHRLGERYSPAVAFSGPTNLRTRRPEIQKKRFFQEYGCICNRNIKAEPWGFPVFALFKVPQGVCCGAIPVMSWWSHCLVWLGTHCSG